MPTSQLLYHASAHGTSAMIATALVGAQCIAYAYVLRTREQAFLLASTCSASSRPLC
jgi:hypothetical protein